MVPIRLSAFRLRLIPLLTVLALTAAPILSLAPVPAVAGVAGTPAFNDVSPQHNQSFNAVAMQGQDVWAAGMDGSILASQDGGQSWTIQQTPTLDDLYAISFASPMDGVAGGAGGALLETLNGGQTWTALTISGTSGQEFTSVATALSGSTLYIFAATSTEVYVSEDGGQTWTATALSSALVAAADSAPGPVALAAVGAVTYQWSAAAPTWTVQTTTFPSSLVNIAMADSQNAEVTDGSGHIWVTANGGATWSDVASIYSPYAASGLGAAAAAVVGGKPEYWILGSNSSFLPGVEYFNGSSWTLLSIPNVTTSSGSLPPEAVAIAANPSNGVVMVGAQGYLAYSTNSGANWSAQETLYPYGISGVSPVPGTGTFVAVGQAAGGEGMPSNGVILRSTDNAQTWTAGAADPALAFSGVSFASSEDGAIVGNAGPPTPGPVVEVSTDAGQTFSQVALPALPQGAYLYGVSTQMSGGKLEIWAVGTYTPSSTPCGLVLYSADGGSSWTVTPVCDGSNAITLYGVSFASPLDGWAVGGPAPALVGNIQTGGPGVIYATTDGGASWTQQDSASSLLSSTSLFGVSAPDAQHVFAVGDGANVFSSTDGGAKWTHVTVPSGSYLGNPHPSLVSVAFSDSLHGILVGGGGTIDTTNDGGSTWIGPQFTGASAILDAAATNGTVMVAGDMNDYTQQFNGMLFATPLTGGTSGPGGPQVPCDPVASPEIIGPPGGVLATPDCLYTEPLAHGALAVNKDLAVQEIPSTFLPALPKGLTLADPIFQVTGASLSAPQVAYVKYDPKVLGGRQPQRLSLYQLTESGWQYVPTNVNLKNNPYPGTVAIYNQGPATYALLENPQVFPDLQQGSQDSGIVDQLLASSATQGFLNGKFLPQVTVNRAQFLKMLMVVAHQPTGIGTGGFQDVDAGTWYAPYVSGGDADGIAQPLDPLHFGPFQPVNRETQAQWIAAALNLAPPKNPPAFTDQAAISPGALQAIEAVVAAGYMQPAASGAFDPKGTMSRLAAAQLLAQIIDSEAP